jgi:hypothetical protein
MPDVIIETQLELDLYGFSGVAQNKDYGATAFHLMDRMWKVIREKGVKNKGLNIWVYEPFENVFAGVELMDNNGNSAGLEHKHIRLPRYGYYKHIGPYSLIRQAGERMREVLERQGFETSLPYIEIYGHWTEDETKLETELLMSLV